jgi:hypothetical protein
MSDSYLHPELYRAASLDGCLNTLVAVSEMMEPSYPWCQFRPLPGPLASSQPNPSICAR